MDAHQLRRTDGGFTLVEVVVAMVLVVAVGASLVAFFVRASALSQSLERRQAAVALADAALEQTRSVTATATDASGSAVVRGRSAAEVDKQWGAASLPVDVGAVLASTSKLSDPLALATSVPVVPFTDTATVSGQPFVVQQLIGTCRRPVLAAAACDSSPVGVLMLRVVVVVSWSEGPGRTCSGTACRFVLSSLVDPSPAPQFMVNGGSIGGQVGVAVPDVVTVKAGTTTQLNVKSNDVGTLDASQPVSTPRLGPGFRGSAELRGTSVGAVTYVAPPATALTGLTSLGGWSVGAPYVETFTYTLTDSRGRTSDALVTLRVVP